MIQRSLFRAVYLHYIYIYTWFRPKSWPIILHQSTDPDAPTSSKDANHLAWNFGIKEQANTGLVTRFAIRLEASLISNQMFFPRKVKMTNNQALNSRCQTKLVSGFKHVRVQPYWDDTNTNLELSYSSTGEGWNMLNLWRKSAEHPRRSRTRAWSIWMCSSHWAVWQKRKFLSDAVVKKTIWDVKLELRLYYIIYIVIYCIIYYIILYFIIYYILCYYIIYYILLYYIILYMILYYKLYYILYYIINFIIYDIIL